MEGKDDWAWLRTFALLAWRFHTGSHMDGRIRRHRNGSVLPRYMDYWWNRYSRPKRALIRNVIFTAFIGFLIGWKVDWPDTKLATLAVCPFLLTRIWLRFVNTFTMVTEYRDSDGVTQKYRIVRPHVQRRLARLKPAKIRYSLPDGGEVPPDVQRAILAENAEDHGEPITSIRAIQEIGDPNNGATVGRERPPNSRARTITRSHQRLFKGKPAGV